MLVWSVKPEAGLGRRRNYGVQEKHGGGHNQVLVLRNSQTGFFWPS